MTIPVPKKKSYEEVLAEINTAHEKQHARSNALLTNIKENRSEIERTLDWFRKEEPDLIYRFYHQSYKAFILND